MPKPLDVVGLGSSASPNRALLLPWLHFHQESNLGGGLGGWKARRGVCLCAVVDASHWTWHLLAKKSEGLSWLLEPLERRVVGWAKQGGQPRRGGALWGQQGLVKQSVRGQEEWKLVKGLFLPPQLCSQL